MEQEKIREIIKEKVAELSELCRKTGKDFDKDTIHAFRVTVKTLRSFLRLLRLNEQKSGLKLPGKFKRLYHIAGAIRDAQLEMEQMADQQAQLPHYIDKLHLVLERQKQEWKKHCTKKTLQKLEETLIDCKYPDLDADTLSNFFNLRLAAIDELGKKTHPTDDQVHTIRKHAKDILYNAKLAKKKWKDAGEQIKDIRVKPLNSLADEIGDYNDQRITLEHLSSFSSRTIKPEEINYIKKICTQDVKVLKAKKKAIMAHVHALTLNARARTDTA